MVHSPVSSVPEPSIGDGLRPCAPPLVSAGYGRSRPGGPRNKVHGGVPRGEAPAARAPLSAPGRVPREEFLGGAASSPAARGSQGATSPLVGMRSAQAPRTGQSPSAQLYFLLRRVPGAKLPSGVQGVKPLLLGDATGDEVPPLPSRADIRAWPSTIMGTFPNLRIQREQLRNG